MPIFEYICRSCRHRFETIVYGATEPECPECKGRELEKQLSTFAVGGSSAESFDSDPVSPCSSCGNPGGPGSCMME